jgi:hypothetical protein
MEQLCCSRRILFCLSCISWSSCYKWIILRIFQVFLNTQQCALRICRFSSISIMEKWMCYTVRFRFCATHFLLYRIVRLSTFNGHLNCLHYRHWKWYSLHCLGGRVFSDEWHRLSSSLWWGPMTVWIECFTVSRNSLLKITVLAVFRSTTPCNRQCCY